MKPFEVASATVVPLVSRRSGPGVDPPPDAEAGCVVVTGSGRPLGALVRDDLRWVDFRRSRRGPLALGGAAVVGATAVGLRWAARPAAVRSITMGHGGWVSFKGSSGVRTPLEQRPWWAALLGGRRLRA